MSKYRKNEVIDDQLRKSRRILRETWSVFGDRNNNTIMQPLSHYGHLPGWSHVHWHSVHGL